MRLLRRANTRNLGEHIRAADILKIITRREVADRVQFDPEIRCERGGMIEIFPLTEFICDLALVSCAASVSDDAITVHAAVDQTIGDLDIVAAEGFRLERVCLDSCGILRRRLATNEGKDVCSRGILPTHDPVERRVIANVALDLHLRSVLKAFDPAEFVGHAVHRSLGTAIRSETDPVQASVNALAAMAYLTAAEGLPCGYDPICRANTGDLGENVEAADVLEIVGRRMESGRIHLHAEVGVGRGGAREAAHFTEPVGNPLLVFLAAAVTDDPAPMYAPVNGTVGDPDLAPDKGLCVELACAKASRIAAAALAND